jgi:hypothetical protein
MINSFFNSQLQLLGRTNSQLENCSNHVGVTCHLSRNKSDRSVHKRYTQISHSPIMTNGCRRLAPVLLRLCLLPPPPLLAARIHLRSLPGTGEISADWFSSSCWAFTRHLALGSLGFVEIRQGSPFLPRCNVDGIGAERGASEQPRPERSTQPPRATSCNKRY